MFRIDTSEKEEIFLKFISKKKKKMRLKAHFQKKKKTLKEYIKK